MKTKDLRKKEIELFIDQFWRIEYNYRDSATLKAIFEKVKPFVPERFYVQYQSVIDQTEKIEKSKLDFKDGAKEIAYCKIFAYSEIYKNKKDKQYLPNWEMMKKNTPKKFTMDIEFAEDIYNELEFLCPSNAKKAKISLF